MSIKGKQFKKSTYEDGFDRVNSYFDSPEFAHLCEKVVEMVERAKRQKLPATYRYFSERIGKHQRQWLYEAVESCKRSGLIKETGSAVRTIFVTGGHEIKPEPAPRYRNIVGHRKSDKPDLGVSK
jgi:hypothetical protein